MSAKIKTFDSAEEIQKWETDPIYQKQKEGVDRMRTALLSCPSEDYLSTKYAIKQVTALRIYHQMMRIVSYTELMDKLEAKLYQSIEYAIDNSSPTNQSTWMMLLSIQEKLQKNMLESQKLIEPYLNMEFPEDITNEKELDHDGILNADSREKIRLGARTVLSQLEELQEEQEESNSEKFNSEKSNSRDEDK